MKSKSLSQKARTRSHNKTASPALIDYLTHKYQHRIPIAAITTAHKLYANTKPLNKEDPFFRKLMADKKNVDTQKLLGYLSSGQNHEKGKVLNEQAIGRVYSNCCNPDGKLSFEYIMKMGESCGVAISERVAKTMVRKYGQRKDHLNVEDCFRINERRANRAGSKSKASPGRAKLG